MHLSTLEYENLVARLNAQRKRQDAPGRAIIAGEGQDRERRLHDAINDECKRRGWYLVHSRLDRPTTNAIGVPDFVIALPNGQTLWLECKAKRGKLTIKQAAAQAWLRKLGHLAETVWTFERFLEIVKEH